MLCQIIHVVLTWFFAMTLPCPAPTRPLANSSLPLAGLGFGLYLFGVVSSYAASTIYHAIPASRASSKAIARKLLPAHLDRNEARRRTCVGLGDLRHCLARGNCRHESELP